MYRNNGKKAIHNQSNFKNKRALFYYAVFLFIKIRIDELRTKHTHTIQYLVVVWRLRDSVTKYFEAEMAVRNKNTEVQAKYPGS